MTDLADAIVWSLGNQPERWRPGNYTTNHDSGLHLWVANGMVSVEIYAPIKISFGLRDKWRIWRAYKRAHRNRRDLVAKLLPPPPEPT